MNAIFDWKKDAPSILLSGRNRKDIEFTTSVMFGGENADNQSVRDSIQDTVDMFKPNGVLTPTLTRGHRHVRDRFSTVDSDVLAAYACQLSASAEVPGTKMKIMDLHDDLLGGAVIYGGIPVTGIENREIDQDAFRLTTPVSVYLTDSSNYGFDVNLVNFVDTLGQVEFGDLEPVYRIENVLLPGHVHLNDNMEFANVLDSSLIMDVPVEFFEDHHIICVTPTDPSISESVFDDEHMIESFNNAFSDKLGRMEWRGGPLTFDEAHDLWIDSATESIPEALRDKFKVVSLTVDKIDTQIAEEDFSLDAFANAFTQPEFETANKTYNDTPIVASIKDLIIDTSEPGIEEAYGLEL